MAVCPSSAISLDLRSVIAAPARLSSLIVRDDDELRTLLELAHQRGEGRQAELIERGVDFVHHAKRAGIQQEEGENQRHRAQRFFTARQQANFLDLLASGLDEDIDASFEYVACFGQFEPALATAQKLGEQFGKIPGRAFERLGEALARLAI